MTWLQVVLVLLSIGKARADELIIGVGSNAHLQASGHIHVTDGKVIKANDQGRMLEIIGKSEGQTTIESDKRIWNIQVIPASDYSLYLKLKSALSTMRGPKLSVTNGAIIVSGRLLRISDWLTIAKLAEQGGRYQLKVEAEESVEKQMEKLTLDEIRRAGLEPIPFTIRDSALLHLPSEMAGQAEAYRQTLTKYGFQINGNSAYLRLAPLVRVNIRVAEVKRAYQRTLGVAWPSSYRAQLLPGSGGSGSETASDGLAVQLNALEENGQGKILAQPNLLCRSGKEAEFLAGGEFPIKIVNFKTHDVVWKKYGVLLKIKPTADFAGRMSIGLTTEVSMLDTSHAVDGIPGLLSNRIESYFDLAKSQTIALSGLLKKEWTDSASGLPALSQIPILGTLFSSHDYQDRQSELFIFVTPEVVNHD